MSKTNKRPALQVATEAVSSEDSEGQYGDIIPEQDQQVKRKRPKQQRGQAVQQVEDE